jgi:hypothetical protein
MVYMTKLAAGDMDPTEIKALQKRYGEYLESVQNHLPLSAYAYATAPWHYDPSDHRCPHDAWVESVTIYEEKNDDNPIDRTINIRIRLLGAYHDGHIELIYQDVNSYALSKPSGIPDTDSIGQWNVKYHWDWLFDEVRLSDRGMAIHEIVFASDAHWQIECRDMAYEWKPLEDTLPRDPRG